MSLVALCGSCIGLAKDRSGNVAIIFGLSLVPLVLAIGAAVDTGRWLHARDATHAAIDAAVLAGGRSLQITNTDEAGAVAAATAFYNENVKKRLPVIDDTVQFAVTDNGKAVTASGNAFIETPFLRLANVTKLPLITNAEAAKAELAVGGNGGESLEVSIMLDVTGSMAGHKLDDLKEAAEDLINIVVWDDQSQYTSKVALVPFSEDIRLPTNTARDKARGTGLVTSKTLSSGSGKNKVSQTYYLSDCVVERTGFAEVHRRCSEIGPVRHGALYREHDWRRQQQEGRMHHLLDLGDHAAEQR